MVLLKRKQCISCLLYLVSLLTFENGDCNIYLLGKTLFIFKKKTLFVPHWCQ